MRLGYAFKKMTLLGTKLNAIYLPPHIAYGVLALFISLLNNVFLLFYVSTFVTVFKIDSTAFWIGETIFLVWNSINDPIFGWFSDHKSLVAVRNGEHTSNRDIVVQRIRALSNCGPLFALSFLLFWFPLFAVSIQFSVALCLYDGFLTMVDLHHQALLADLTINDRQRAKLNSYCSFFSAIGSVSVFVSFALWDKDDLGPFQTFCVLLAGFVAAGFLICCRALSHAYDKGHKSDDRKTNLQEEKSDTEAAGLSVTAYFHQVLQHKNFLWFAAMNLIQVFHCHFNSNFFPLFLQHLLGHVLSPAGGAFLLGFSFLVPHLNNLYFLHLCQSHGAFAVVKWLFYVKLGLAVCMWGLGDAYWLMVCLFIASNRVFTEGTCKLLSLVITDLVDEDYVKFRRKSAVSALVFGTSALLSKPGQTLAPLLGSYLIYLHTGKSLFFSPGTNPVVASSSRFADHDPEWFRKGCFSVLVYVPVVCALVQILIWKCFTLKGSRLASVKTLRASLERNAYVQDLV